MRLQSPGECRQDRLWALRFTLRQRAGPGRPVTLCHGALLCCALPTRGNVQPRSPCSQLRGGTGDPLVLATTAFRNPPRGTGCCDGRTGAYPASRLWGFLDLEGEGGELVGVEKEFPSSCPPCSALVQRAARL